jgi:hypothetical protein
MLNELVCADQQGGNTGTGTCYLDPKNIIGAFIAPIGKAFSSVETADSTLFLAALEAATILSPSARIYPIQNFTGFVDSSSEAAKQTFIYGSIAVASEGKYDWTFQYQKGGACLNKQLRKFNGGAWSVFFYDAAGIVYGYKNGTDLVGIPLDLLYVPKFKINDYANVTLYAIELMHDPIYLNDKIGFVSADVTSLQAVGGINDVALSQTRSTNVLTVKAKTGCSGVDMYDLYSGDLDVVGAWVVKNVATGNLVTITSVAVDTNAHGWTLTLNASDPDYSATVGAMTLSLASASALDALNVAKYESNTITV